MKQTRANVWLLSGLLSIPQALALPAAFCDRKRRNPGGAVCAVAAAVAVAVAVVVASAAATAADRPARIVSMNLCTDQLLILLADRPRIASVSFLAAQPGASALADEAAGLTLNYGLVEQILPLEPDLVLAGTFTTRPTVFLLKRLGYRIVEVPVASKLDDIRANIRTIADAIGEKDRGEALIAAFDRDLADASAADLGDAPLAVLYWANSYSSGRATLADAVVRKSGFRNLAAERGVSGTVQLPLESLLAAEPDLLIVGRERDGPALATVPLHHPALRRAFADRPRVAVPDYLWVCGTPFVAEAVRRLRQAWSTAENSRQ